MLLQLWKQEIFLGSHRSLSDGCRRIPIDMNRFLSLNSFRLPHQTGPIWTNQTSALVFQAYSVVESLINSWEQMRTWVGFGSIKSGSRGSSGCLSQQWNTCIWGLILQKEMPKRYPPPRRRWFLHSKRAIAAQVVITVQYLKSLWS